MRKILLFLFTILFTLPALADTFTVTSNADSGPGTLRQGLLDAAANGSAVKDYIVFNIADLSDAGRTITLLSQLPDLTSNLILDGTTQPGAVFGVSAAKIIVTAAPVSNVTEIFKLYNISYCEVDGFYIIGNAAQKNYLSNSIVGVTVNQGSSITIGRPGGGNLIANCYIGVNVIQGYTISIQSNITGVKSDGITPYKNYVPIEATNVVGIAVGGYQDLTYGNVLSDYGQDKVLLSGCVSARVSHNLIGTDYTGNATLGPSFIGTNFSVYGVLSTGGLYLTIDNNVFANLGNAITIISPGSGLNVYTNKFGTGLTDNANLGNRQAINIVNFNFVGAGNVNSNVIANNESGISISGSTAVTLSKNSFSCNAKNSIVFDNSQVAIPFVDITNKSATQVSGTATANCNIELFYTDECNLCQGKTYLATVQSDASGNWSYSGLISGAVVGTATTTTGATSPFSAPEVIFGSQAVIKNANCGNRDGSITGITYHNATNFTWTDAIGNIVGNNKDLTGVSAGKYQVKVDNGTCSTVSQYFEIKDNSVKVDDTNLTTVNESCALATGSIKGLQITALPGYTVVWKNASGTIVGNTIDLNGIKAGNYTLYVASSDNACTQVYGPVNIISNPPLNLDQTPMAVTPTNCGQSIGSVANIVVTGGVQPYKYSWRNTQGIEVATTKDLIAKPAGTYTLQVTDQTNCGQVSAPGVTILELNGITMDETGAITTPVSCSGNSGGITGIVVTGATTYRWYNSNNSNIPVGINADYQATLTGSYYLVATNAGGCSKTSKIYTVTGFTNTDNYGGITKDLQNATCGSNNGSIGVRFITNGQTVATPASYRWANHATGQTIAGATTAVLSNIDAGSYDVYALNSQGCERFLITYSISRTASFNIVTTGARPSSDNCSHSNGSITGIIVTGAAAGYSVTWTDANGHIVGSNLDLKNVSAGSYTLTVTTADKSCSQTYGPVTLTNTTTAGIDQTNPLITPTTCAQAIGSITNITVRGIGLVKYSWKNEQGTEVSTTKDLTGQPAGTYTLQVNDEGGCGTVYSLPIIIPEINNVVMDESGALPAQVNCSGTGGGITGIQVSGATVFKWFNSGGALVGLSVDLTGIAAGTYYLVASTANGCSKTSKTYTVAQQSNTDDYGSITPNTINATCGQNNGIIEITLTGGPTAQPAVYRWVNQATGQTVGTTTAPKLGGLDSGTYDIYVSNSAGCERLLVSYPVYRTSALTADISNVRVTDDNCNASAGSIIGPLAAGVTPLVYAWTDDNGKAMGSGSNLTNILAGTYHLKITDGANCDLGYTYTLVNKFENLTSPDVKDVQLCGSGSALIRVLNSSPDYTYRLYENMYDTDPVDVQSKGIFKVNVKTNRSYYVSKSVGECESGRVEVKVTVGITASSIANTFSPNGDGVNDTWKIAGIEGYPNAQVQIFTRTGQKVFESNGYSVPFDGTYGGKPLPVAAYYYIINLNSGCRLLSGSITLVR